MTPEQAKEKARGIAIWLTGGVIEFEGTATGVTEAWQIGIATALLSSYKAGMIRAAEISRNTDTGDTHGYWIAQAIEKEVQENGDKK